jgi:cellulose synthase (UDP-forming)
MSHLLPKVCARARTEVAINLVLLIITMGAFVLFFVENYFNNANMLSRFLPGGTGPERAVYNAIFGIFMFGSFAYQAARLSFFWNVRARADAAQASLERFAATDPAAAPRIEVVVPSYREESHVVWQTLMSAVLVDYANRGVVLLLDNPPNPSNADDRNLLLSARAQVDLINETLAPLAARYSTAAMEFRGKPADDLDLIESARVAAALRVETADWLEGLAAGVERGDFGGDADHTRKFFVERILREPAQTHRARATALLESTQSYAQLEAEFGRLAAMFDVRVSLFERKKFANLSHAPTKAANLNSYISVMGRRLKRVPAPNGIELIDVLPSETCNIEALLEPRDAKYVIILDADSFLLRDYATAMVAAMESPENARAAVMQTPYTAIPDTPHMLERVAGATTDIYFYVTEGMGFAHSGFWVGASATIRKQALIEIAVSHSERGYSFPVYIQDKTVIEDTGATIDLIEKGWHVENYPARLSYSATPSDFGALVVQRRRWANGGLIILPSLLRHLCKVRPTLKSVLEAIFRVHYLIMPACISVSMLLMLVYPFDFKRVSSWIYVTLPPYLYLVCRDLRFSGYRRSDILRAYALFLVLLPVVLTGVKNSLLQILFGIKAQFGRTPKINQRTSIPLTCTAAIMALFGWSLAISYADVFRGDGLHAVFAFSNVLALGYGLVLFMGPKAIAEDFANAISTTAVDLYRLLVPVRTKDAVVEPAIVVTLPSLQPELAPSITPSHSYATPTVLQRTANRLRQSTSLLTANLQFVSSGPLQPISDSVGQSIGRTRMKRGPRH